MSCYNNIENSNNIYLIFGYITWNDSAMIVKDGFGEFRFILNQKLETKDHIYYKIFIWFDERN